MSIIYRVIEHKDDLKQEHTLDRSLGGKLRVLETSEAANQGISEVYRGEIKPIIGQCQNCAFWKQASVQRILQVYGTCQAKMHLSSSDVLLWSSGDDGEEIETAEEFGCIMWRGKPIVEGEA